MNLREGWRGHLWQGRFASFPLDQDHLLAAARYVELNPVRAGIRRRPETHPWSSARTHSAEKGDALVKVAPLLGMVVLEVVGDRRTFLAGGPAQPRTHRPAAGWEEFRCRDRSPARPQPRQAQTGTEKAQR